MRPHVSCQTPIPGPSPRHKDSHWEPPKHTLLRLTPLSWLAPQGPRIKSSLCPCHPEALPGLSTPPYLPFDSSLSLISRGPPRTHHHF